MYSIYDHRTEGGMGTWAMLSSRTWATPPRKCPICLVTMKGRRLIGVTSCGHEYHLTCINKVTATVRGGAGYLCAGLDVTVAGMRLRSVQHMTWPSPCCPSIPAVADPGAPLPLGPRAMHGRAADPEEGTVMAHHANSHTESACAVAGTRLPGRRTATEGQRWAGAERAVSVGTAVRGPSVAPASSPSRGLNDCSQMRRCSEFKRPGKRARQ